MQNNEIALLNKFGIAKGGNFNYSESANAFLGNGYTSAAGNTYLNAIRLVEGIVIKEDVGHGYAHSFINGIRIYDIQNKTLLCEQSYHCAFYNTSFIKSQGISMLFTLLIDASKKEGYKVNSNEVHNHIETIVTNAFNEDQRQLLFNQTQKYLNQ